MSRHLNGADVERLIEERIEAALAKAGLVTVTERPRRVIRFGDAQRELGCSKTHVRNLIDRELLRASKLGGLLLIDYESYQDYLASAVPVKPKGGDR